jgi:histidyl-tRNA synthetase
VRSDAEAILLADDLLRAAGVPCDLHVGHLAPMKHLLSGLELTVQAKAMAFLDKRDFDGLSGFLGGIGQEVLVQRLKDLAHARTLGELFSVIGEIPEKKRIEEIVEILEKNRLVYTLDFGIARGLDYYTGMVFEGFAPNLGAEDQVLGGGAYRLAHLFGGDDVPSCGFAIGFDRLMVALGEVKADRKIRVAICTTEEGRIRGFEVAKAFRDRGICAELDLLDRNLGAQMAHAAKAADFAVILGQREVATGTVTMKDLHSGEQKVIPLDIAVAEVAARVTRR